LPSLSFGGAGTFFLRAITFLCAAWAALLC
jgi:hypothetical protein